MMSASASHGNFSVTIVSVIWTISASLVTLSACVCGMLTLRRSVRNAIDRKRVRHNQIYDRLIADVLNKPECAKSHRALIKFRGLSSAMTRSMLNYFRTVKGQRANDLRAFICNSKLERRIILATRKGTRGRRMRAVQVLSYFETEAALHCIRGHLKSQDRYERLTAARALARQKSLGDSSAVLASLATAFPKKPDLIAEVLESFGPAIQPRLEYIARTSNRDTAIIACLMALRALGPAATELDLSLFMERESADVRGAAISLSAVCADASCADLLPIGLSDNAIGVKIRSAKIACDVARKDLTPHLYALTKDPAFWVRYWAIRGIWKLGRTGRQMVASLASSDEVGSEMAAHVALEMEAAGG